MPGGTTQAPASTYLVGGMPTLTGWDIFDVKRSIVEDKEDTKTPLGQHKCRITYSRRETLSMRLVALAAASVHTYTVGGTVASGVFTLADGTTATAWDIDNVEEVPTRGPMEVLLSLIQQGDKLAVS